MHHVCTWCPHWNLSPFAAILTFHSRGATCGCALLQTLCCEGAHSCLAPYRTSKEPAPARRASRIMQCSLNMYCTVLYCTVTYCIRIWNQNSTTNLYCTVHKSLRSKKKSLLYAPENDRKHRHRICWKPRVPNLYESLQISTVLYCTVLETLRPRLVSKLIFWL